MNVIFTKFKEVLFSVLPIFILVLLLHFTTISTLDTKLLIKFVIGTVLILIGLTVFLIGVDIGIAPLGNLTGKSLVKSNKLWLAIGAALLLGFLVSIAEPGLIVFSNQVGLVTSGKIPGILVLVVVSIGFALLMSVGFVRVFYNIPLYVLFLIVYGIIFVFALFTSPEFLAIAFDASGSTTGVLAVPFVLALSVGISSLKKDSKASENDSFGLVATAGTGAILAIMVLNIFYRNTHFTGSLDLDGPGSGSIIKAFTDILLTYFNQSMLAILPLTIILIILQIVVFKLSRKQFRRMLTGFIFAFLGLFIFLVGVNGGFMEVGASIGNTLALKENKAFIIIIGLFLGVVTILAEPAVHILTHQIEDVTSGYVSRKAVLIALSIGVGLAVMLSVIRVLVPQIQLWHYLLPGYIICLILMFFVPKLFIGMAFDAGVVATGPMTATFSLAFIQGAANAFAEANILTEGFGMIAMVALFPILTLEILGLMFKIKSKAKGVQKTDE
ncbi:MAG TPA: DUF1538 domain-containing protein [Clostridiales bacterium]|nr:DUF1538 domain-containing protein [Clostridiales bacterium]